MQFRYNAIQSFHENGFALRPALKQRYKELRNGLFASVSASFECNKTIHVCVAGWTPIGYYAHLEIFEASRLNCSLLKEYSKMNYFCNFVQVLAVAAPLQTHLTAKFMMILLLYLAVSRLLLTILQPWETSWFQLCPAQGFQMHHPTLASVEEINQEVCMQA